VHTVSAEIARAEGRYTDAIANYRRGDVAPDGPVDACTVCLPLALARAFDEAGMRDSAIVAYETYVRTPFAARFSDVFDGAQLPRIHERLGQLYDAAGDTTRALSNYAAFVELWRNADRVLQPRVSAARQRIDALERR
jgi:tetratricopeptide (TPR) repeat protein